MYRLLIIDTEADRVLTNGTSDDRAVVVDLFWDACRLHSAETVSVIALNEVMRKDLFLCRMANDETGIPLKIGMEGV